MESDFDFIDVDQAATLIGTAQATLSAWIARNEGPARLLVDGTVLLETRDVRAWIRALPVSPEGIPLLPGATPWGTCLH